MKIAEKLFNLALEARNMSYSPYSEFKVGAAIFSDDEKFYSSCNVENVSYPCGSCAETGAISAMIAGGSKKIREILVIADSKNIISPCGACRQRILEFSDSKTMVHMSGLDGIKKSMKAKDLLPLAFDEKELKND